MNNDYYHQAMPGRPNTDGRMMTREEIGARIMRLQAAAESCEPDDALRITMLQEIQILRVVMGDRPCTSLGWGTRTAGEIAHDIVRARHEGGQAYITLPAPAEKEVANAPV